MSSYKIIIINLNVSYLIYIYPFDIKDNADNLLILISHQHFIKYVSSFKKSQKSAKLHCSEIPSTRYNDEIVPL